MPGVTRELAVGKKTVQAITLLNASPGVCKTPKQLAEVSVKLA